MLARSRRLALRPSGGPHRCEQTATVTRAFEAAMTGLMQVMHLETRSGARTLIFSFVAT
jgi:hypothetical protein